MAEQYAESSGYQATKKTQYKDIPVYSTLSNQYTMTVITYAMSYKLSSM